jgi:hypothetical protein
VATRSGVRRVLLLWGRAGLEEVGREQVRRIERPRRRPLGFLAAVWGRLLIDYWRLLGRGLRGLRRLLCALLWVWLAIGTCPCDLLQLLRRLARRIERADAVDDADLEVA